MPKPNCAWVSTTGAQGSGLWALGKISCPQPRAPSPDPIGVLSRVVSLIVVTGCATPQYAMRGTPVPDESLEARAIERSISAAQAGEFQQQGAWPIGLEERVGGFAVQRLVDRLSAVTERAWLRYHAFLYQDHDPNAAALADGRIYISSGLMAYLAGRGPSTSLRAVVSEQSESNHGSRESELAFVLAHEIGHTVAQHLVKRYHTLERQQLLMSLVAAGAAAATRGASSGVQEAGQLATDAASLLADVANSGYSQSQELEADQLGIRYMIRAGFDPTAALDLLQDFARFDSPSPFLRTHPYVVQRRTDLQRYLADIGYASAPKASGGLAPRPPGDLAERVRPLRQAQALSPKDSISWKNLQRQIAQLEAQHAR